jgi:hypothetical protein
MGVNDGQVVGTTQIVDHGPASQKWNLVILCDGYKASELPKFHTDCAAFVNTMFATPPFDELWCGMNVFRIDVSSTDSGAKDPTACGGSGANPKTYFDASFCNGGIQRLLEVNNSTVHTVVNAQMPQAHMIMVMVNSTEYGGSGGDVATFSLASGANEIGLHEMGHTAFGFADEYEYYAGCGSGETGHDKYTGVEPSQPNVTANANRATNKWRDLVAAATPMPTTSNKNCKVCDPQANPLPASTVGAYEGAFYNHCGAYRPQFNCRMRALNNPYCAVCQRVIRQTISPFMSSWVYGTNTIGAGQTQRWWLSWGGYPGFEVIGVQSTTAGAELDWDTPGMQKNPDGSTLYWITVRNKSTVPVVFHFRGSLV